MDILKIAVVGTGNRAQAHLATIPKLADRYRLVAVCDIDAARGNAVAERFKVASYTEVEQMLEQESLDVVLIVVPPEGHHIVTAQAARRGVHVITETPISFSLACAQAMIDVCQEQGVALEVSENVRRWPNERLKRRILESGVMGQPAQIHCCYASGLYHGISAIRNCALAEAQQVIGHAQHVSFSEAHWFDPFFHRAAQQAPGIPSAPQTPDANTRAGTWELGVTTFENGVTSMHQFPIGAHRGNHWEIDATQGHIIAQDVFLADDGRFTRQAFETISAEVDSVETIAALRLNSDPSVVWENPHRGYPLSDADDIARADVLVSMHRAVTEGTEVEYGGIGGFKDLEMMIAARESALRGSVPLSLPIQGALEYDQIQHEEYAAMYGSDPLEGMPSSSWKQEATLSS